MQRTICCGSGDTKATNITKNILFISAHYPPFRLLLPLRSTEVQVIISLTISFGGHPTITPKHSCRSAFMYLCHNVLQHQINCIGPDKLSLLVTLLHLRKNTYAQSKDLHMQIIEERWICQTCIIFIVLTKYLIHLWVAGNKQAW